MGAGIALQIAKKYPEAKKADENFSYPPSGRLGKCSVAKTYDGKMIVNLYAQKYPGKVKYGNVEKEQNERYQAFEKGLKSVLASLPTLKEKGFPIKIGLPYLIGCDLAGGDWQIVYGIIEKLSSQYNQDIYVYKLEKKKID
jgi:O-acetyl-ADP-ribose deacetylase (regulator of RNase III)